MKTGTMWRLGSRVLFGQMYEDFAIEKNAFPLGSRVFAIASAGDTAIALSGEHDVTAVDINQAQLAYAQQRAAGAPAQYGMAERWMKIHRRLASLTGWTPRRLEQFVQLSDCREQVAFWQDHLHTRFFRFCFDGAVAVALWMLRLIAPGRAFLPPKHMGARLRERLLRGFALYSNRNNLYAQRLIAGHLTPARHPALRSIRFVHADAVQFLQNSPAASFDAFTLSNIVDGVTADYSQRLFAAVRHAAAPEAVAVLRSFRDSPHPGASAMAAQDRSLLWGSVYVVPARSLAACFTS